MKTLFKILIALSAMIVATCMAAVLIMHDASGRLVLAGYFGSAIITAMILGVFDVAHGRHERNSIKRTASLRNAA